MPDAAPDTPDKSGPASYIGFYRTGLTTPAHRRHLTVGRDHVLTDTLETLGRNAGRPAKHHLLFIGMRGMGKTHLLSLIQDSVEEDPQLSGKYTVVRFPEESHRTLSFADFLLGICEILAAVVTETPPAPQPRSKAVPALGADAEETSQGRDGLAAGTAYWKTLHQKLRTEENDQTVVDTLVPAIRREHKISGRTLLIMMENVGEIFTNQMKDKREVAALRKFLMDSKNGCLFIGTATMHFEGITSINEPFYDFFDVQMLDHLTEQQSVDLIRRYLKWEKREDLLTEVEFKKLHPKLLALYRMTGGSPRLTMMLAELIGHDSVTAVRDQFRILLDRVTPFFQDRLRDIPPQERAVLETMAVMRDTEKTPGSIAERMRMKLNKVSVLLKRLTDARHVRSSPHPGDKRRQLYTIAEGLFDLWLWMNLSRGARDRLPFLLDFFALFYPSYLEREEKRRQLREQYGLPEKKADARAALDLLTEIGEPAECARAKLDFARILSGDAEATGDNRLLQEAAALPLDRMGRWITTRAAEHTTDYLTELDTMIHLWDEHRTGNLEAFSRRMMETAEGMDYLSYSKAKLAFLEEHLEEMPPSPDRIRTRLRIARIHHEHAHWLPAEQQGRSALEEAEENGQPGLISWALNDFAQLLHATNRLAEAETLMRRALAIDEISFGSDHPRVATNISNLALLLEDTNRLAEAETLMRRALAIGEASLGSNHPKVAIRLNNLAHLLQSTDRLAEAETLMRRALAIDEASFDSGHPNVAIRLNNLASLLQATNRLAEAEPLLRHALAISEASFGSEHPNVAVNVNNLAQLLEDTNRLTEAETLRRRALAIDEASFGSDHPNVAIRLNNLAQLLKDTNRLAEAEPLMRRVVEIRVASTAATGHPHPRLMTAANNYTALLKAMGETQEQAREKVDAILAPVRDKLRPS
jgi:tetratricopeptide (TPR) repeat protein